MPTTGQTQQSDLVCDGSDSKDASASLQALGSPQEATDRNATPYVERPHNALRPDAQAFDQVIITTVPRFKESYLSGDEWRISARIQFWRKGVLVHEEGSRNIETACQFLGWYHCCATEDGKAYFAGERDVCDQEGCHQSATTWLRLKAHYSREGFKGECSGVEYRKFCDRHKHRGNCGLDDADSNYDPMERPAATPPQQAGADTEQSTEASNPKSTVSP